MTRPRSRKGVRSPRLGPLDPLTPGRHYMGAREPRDPTSNSPSPISERTGIPPWADLIGLLLFGSFRVRPVLFFGKGGSQVLHNVILYRSVNAFGSPRSA